MDFSFTRHKQGGLAIALLGGFVAVMTVRKMRDKQKVVFTVLTFALVFIEIQAINSAGKELRDNFDASLKRLNENLYNITGADSFPYIVPQPSIGDNIPLVIWNAGDYPLTGVTVTIMDRGSFTKGTGEFGAADIDVGVLPPHGHRSLKQFIRPKLDETEEDTYIIGISAQNGIVDEVLKFRRGKNGIPWAYMYTADKRPNRFGPQTPSKPPNTNIQSTSSGVWSDDPEFDRRKQNGNITLLSDDLVNASC